MGFFVMDTYDLVMQFLLISLSLLLRADLVTPAAESIKLNATVDGPSTRIMQVPSSTMSTKLHWVLRKPSGANTRLRGSPGTTVLPSNPTVVTTVFTSPRNSRKILPCLGRLWSSVELEHIIRMELLSGLSELFLNLPGR